MRLRGGTSIPTMSDLPAFITVAFFRSQQAVFPSGMEQDLI
jgi:hypothetical protein